MVVEEIADYLKALSYGSIFRNAIPPGSAAGGSDVCIALIAYGPTRSSEGRFGSVELFREHPRVQVFVRGVPNDSLEPAQRANALYLEVGRIPVPTVIGGVRYLEVHILQPPAPLKQDENKCFRFAFNVEFYKDVSPT